MWVKICGTTSLEDAQVAIEAGADAIGFVFAESPRRLSPDKAAQIIAELPDDIDKVGVFVGDSPFQIAAIAKSIGLTAVQVYGVNALKDWIAANGLRGKKSLKLIVALSGDQIAEGSCNLTDTDLKPVFAVLVDAVSQSGSGGTGTPFDWSKAQKNIEDLSMRAPVIVAGGLRSDNIGRAIKLFQPWGLDVCSGVEAERGRKDPEKVRTFVATARAASRKH